MQGSINVRAKVPDSTWLAPGMMGYVEMEVGTRCTEGVFFPNEANNHCQYLFPGIVCCQPARRGNISKLIVPYANYSTSFVELNPEVILGYLEPCAMIPYCLSQRKTACAVTSRIKEIKSIDDAERLQKLYTIVDSLFEEHSKENMALRNLIRKHPSVFALKNEPLTITPYYCHIIRQKTEQPVYSKLYPIPLKFHGQVEEQLQELYNQGLIRPSCSAYNSPLVPVTKKDRGIRLCLDFRKLNDEIINDKHPLPNMQTIMQQLGHGKIFTSLDLRTGYHQVPLAEEFREKTAFCTPYGMWGVYLCSFWSENCTCCISENSKQHFTRPNRESCPSVFG